MKTFEILHSSNLRILRNGKIVTPRKNDTIKKKAVLKMKIDKPLFFSNELKIYNELEPKKEINTELVPTKNTIQTAIPPISSSKKNNINNNTNSVTNQNSDVRITRGKTIQLQIEERKQLDQIIISKFPNYTFKMSEIKLDDISEEAKFLRTLGLICRFKCPLTTCKLRKKH